MGKIVVAADDKGVKAVLGIEIRVFNLLSGDDRSRSLFRFRFLTFLIPEQKLHIIGFIEHFRYRDLEKNLKIIDNIIKHDRLIRGNAYIDDIVPDIRDLQIFDPGCIGNIRQTVFIVDMFFDPQPSLSDYFFVHKFLRQ